MSTDQCLYQQQVVIELSLGCKISCCGESCRRCNGERYCPAINSRSVLCKHEGLTRHAVARHLMQAEPYMDSCGERHSCEDAECNSTVSKGSQSLGYTLDGPARQKLPLCFVATAAVADGTQDYLNTHTHQAIQEVLSILSFRHRPRKLSRAGFSVYFSARSHGRPRLTERKDLIGASGSREVPYLQLQSSALENRTTSERLVLKTIREASFNENPFMGRDRPALLLKLVSLSCVFQDMCTLLARNTRRHRLTTPKLSQ